MLKNPDRLARFEQADNRRRFRSMSYSEALRLFESLWAEATVLGMELPGDWRADLESDFAIARAINGLPPSP